MRRAILRIFACSLASLTRVDVGESALICPLRAVSNGGGGCARVSACVPLLVGAWQRGEWMGPRARVVGGGREEEAGREAWGDEWRREREREARGDGSWWWSSWSILVCWRAFSGSDGLQILCVCVQTWSIVLFRIAIGYVVIVSGFKRCGPYVDQCHYLRKPSANSDMPSCIMPCTNQRTRSLQMPMREAQRPHPYTVSSPSHLLLHLTLY